MTFVRSDNIPVVILSFYAPYQSGKVKLDEDSIDYVWATYEEAKRYDLIEGLLDEIKMVDDLKNIEGHIGGYIDNQAM